jgi:hypothetical protein
MDFETIRQWVGLGLIQPTVAFLVDMWFDHKELAQLAEERALSVGSHSY